MNKKIKTGIIIFIFILIILATIILLNRTLTRKYTIEELTGINFDTIEYVVYDEQNNYDINKFKNEFENIKLTKNKYIFERIEQTRDITIPWKCYNANGENILTLRYECDKKYLHINNEKYIVR